MPEVRNITRTDGLAGQVAYTCLVDRGLSEPPEKVTFVGNHYGGPVFVVTDGLGQCHVSDPERFGPFGPQWVRNFYAV